MLGFQPTSKPFFSYEGPGFQREFIIIGGPPKFDLKFSYTTPPENSLWELDGINDTIENRIVDFSGKLEVDGDKFSVTGELSAKHSGIITCNGTKQLEIDAGTTTISIQARRMETGDSRR